MDRPKEAIAAKTGLWVFCLKIFLTRLILDYIYRLQSTHFLLSQMKISGFTMVRNATKLYYPIRPAIESILPIVDEFVVALGKSDEDDHTEQEILNIKSDKIKIIRTVWDLEKYPRGTVHAQQTNLAKEHCTGDWLFYVQSDEVVHEKYLPVIKKRCEELLHDREV